MKKIPFRNDRYGKSFYIVRNGKEKYIPYKINRTKLRNLEIDVTEKEEEHLLKIHISISGKALKDIDILGFRLGIDTYMESYPQWNKIFFPTAMRCEKNGFYSLFKTPEGKMLSICSPNKIRSWRNEYVKLPGGEPGHRIKTSSVEFINRFKQPERHPENPIGNCSFTLYFSYIETEDELLSFIKTYAEINIPHVNRFTLSPYETLLINGKPYNKPLDKGYNLIRTKGYADISVYIRDQWFFYLEAAAKAAERCQQKPGSHCESYYGLFTMAEYGKVINNKEYTLKASNEFDNLLKALTFKGIIKPAACPHRLQNVSTLISLSADYYELTGNEKYLELGNRLATFLMHQQWKDGSYRNFGIHYTCVIYPGKSMLEFSIAEKEAYEKTGNKKYLKRSKKHFTSAEKAIDNLIILKDNIGTEGQSTFEDGMISCAVLQIAYFALLTKDKEKRKKSIETAEYLLKKHSCLEQNLIPDCRTRGCTLRFWEARYDINYFENMLNSPHGWTSWKNYGVYYLYLLTGKYKYLKDLSDTIGACMQCITSNGILNWAFVPDPYIIGKSLIKEESKKGKPVIKERYTGEAYLPMISDWYKQPDNRLVWQYMRYPKLPFFKKLDYGGSCDNNVHEHFKCLMETVFGKAFIHEELDGTIKTYNCQKKDKAFVSNDPYVDTVIYKSLNKKGLIFNGISLNVKEGINIIDLKKQSH